VRNSFIVWRAGALSRRAGPKRSAGSALARRKWRNEARRAILEVRFAGMEPRKQVSKPGIVSFAQRSGAVDLYLKEIKRTN
jgi:hypothetical protein